jgi:hypothetical protein
MKLESDLFIVKPMNAWLREAAKSPAPKNLFGDFWIEGELAVLFSDAGKGKSLLAAQIAQSIASGVPIAPLSMTAEAQKVLHIDFELSSMHFARRYSADPGPDDERLKIPFRFSKNYHRITPSAGIREMPPEFKTLEHWFLASIEDKIRSTRAKVVIIDSIVWLQGERMTARHTVPLMRQLQRLRSRYDLSILILAPNSRRDTFQPLRINSLYGAGVMRNFADSVFALGDSRIDASFRYIKHLKSRSTEIVCGEDNVLVGEIRKWEKNFLSFRFHRYSPESDHLVRELNPMVEARAAMIREMSDDGKTQREIAKKLGISLGSVNRYLQMTRDDDDYFDLDDGFIDPDEDEEAEEPEQEKNLEGGPWWMPCKDPELRRQTYLMRYKLGPYAEDADAREKATTVPEEEDISGAKDPLARYGMAGFDPKNRSNDRKPFDEDDFDDDDEDPMARYGLTREDDAKSSRSHQGGVAVDSVGMVLSENNSPFDHGELRQPGELGKLKYQLPGANIEVGDIVLRPDGRLQRRTNWGWDDDVE